MASSDSAEGPYTWRLLRRSPIAAVVVLAALLATLLGNGGPSTFLPAAAAAAAPPNTIAAAAEAAGLTQLSLALNTVGGKLLAEAKNSSTAVTLFAPTDKVSLS